MQLPNFLVGGTPLKRFLIRLSALGGMGTLGFIAIAQAQRFGAKETEPPAAAAAEVSPTGTQQTAATTPTQAAPSASDPFAATRASSAPTSLAQGQSGGGNLFDQAREAFPAGGGRYGQSNSSATQASNDRTMAVRGQDAPATTGSADSRYGDTSRGRYGDPFGDRYGPSGASSASSGASSDYQSSAGQSSAARSAGGASAALDIADRNVRGAGAESNEPANDNRMDRYGRENASTSTSETPAASDRFTQQEPTPAERASEPPITQMPATSSTLNQQQPPARLPADTGNPLRRMPSTIATTQFNDAPLGRLNSSGPAGEEGTGRPGQAQMEGVQSPAVTIEKFAPAQVQIGKPALFEIVVRNNGKVRAQAVTVQDQIPRKTRLVSTTPEAQRSATGELVWNLGNLEPGEERTVKMEVAPVEEGELGSIALVSFSAATSAKTVATRPELQLEVTAPKEVLIGGDVPLTIKISNPGTGPASGVLLREVVPDHFTHPGGGELEYEVGELKPGESRELELVLKAAKAGPAANVLTARGEGSLQAKSVTELNVVAPGLQVSMTGPKRRFLDREATYTVSVSNPGTAAAREVELVTYLPKGLNFVRADNYGEYDAKNRAVRWSLEELPASESGNVTVTTMPVEAGEHKVIVEGTAEKGLTSKHEQPVLVEGVAAILFQVVDVDDPIEVNGETTYEIRVVNQGSKAATEVQLEAQFPSEMRPLSAEGPVRNQISGTTVRFDPLARLAPKADTTYRIRARGLQPGDMRVRVRVMSNEITAPVVKEESTRVFADE